MAYNDFSDIPISDREKNLVRVRMAVTGDKLTGTVEENKEVFDAYPDVIATHFNDLCDFIDTQVPTGDVGLSYTSTEIAYICSVLGCTEADITL